MTQLPKLGQGNIFTYRKLFQQDLTNSITNFTANALYQDFTLFGLPAQHIILGVKISILINFVVGSGNTMVCYVGNPNVFPAIPTPFVTNINDCYGYANLVVPPGSGDSYQYGSFRWFSLATPGSNTTINQALCLPKRMDAHDVVARVVVGGDPTYRVNMLTAGAVNIDIQYGAI